ncbi:MAG: tetratricopeptide repeat protein [Polyangiaceae bacterium]|nr:tetratricopeptide repeat protein [Polyangiaceae bacterium]
MRLAHVVLAACLGFGTFACAAAAPLPPQALALNRSGAEAAANGDSSTAEARLSLAIEYNPRFTEAWVNLGLVELRRGNLDQAQAHFRKARDLNADLPTPHHGLGLISDRRGLGTDAERNYRAALAVDPGFVPARVNLARRLFARGAFDDARMEFLRLTQVAPQEVSGFVGLSESLLKLGRETEAEAVVADAEKKFPNADETRFMRAKRSLRQNAFAAAEAELMPLTLATEKTVAASAWAHIAVARLARGDREGARGAAHAAQDLDPKEPVASYVLTQSK